MKACVIPKVAEPSMTGLPSGSSEAECPSLVNQWIRRSQPSVTWPSDHFMLLAEIK